jgi:hypothetical protein
MATGRPYRATNASDLVDAAHRAVRARRQRRAHLLRDPPGGHLVAERVDGRGGGPIQVSPASMTARAKAAFSARNPYPGWTASAPASAARLSIFSTLR